MILEIHDYWSILKTRLSSGMEHIFDDLSKIHVLEHRKVVNEAKLILQMTDAISASNCCLLSSTLLATLYSLSTEIIFAD